MTNFDKMLTYQQAAQWYGVTERHLKQLRADGKITAHERPNRKTRYFDPEELDNVLGKPTPNQLITNLLSHLPRRYHEPIRDLIRRIDLGELPPNQLFFEYHEPPNLEDLLALNDAELKRTLDALADQPAPEPAPDLLEDFPDLDELLAADIDLDGYD